MILYVYGIAERHYIAQGVKFMTYRRRLKYYLLRFFRTSTSPYLASGGFACGIFTHFYPTFGFGLALAIFLSKITRTSALASSISWAVCSPLFPILFYFNLITGDLLLKGKLSLFLSLHQIEDIKAGCLHLGQSFFLGSIINSIIGCFILWIVGYFFLKKYNQRALCYIKNNL